MKLLMEQWKSYLDEVEDFPDIANSQEEIQKSLDYFYKEFSPTKGKRQDLGSWKGYNLVMFDATPGKHFYVVDDEDIAKAYIAVEPYEDGYAVGNARKTSGGFKISEFYEYLIQQLGTLYSDKAQTSAGRKIWKHIPHEEVPTKDGGTRLKATSND
jgi:hypothetical protein